MKEGVWSPVTLIMTISLLVGTFGCAKPASTSGPAPDPTLSPTPTPSAVEDACCEGYTLLTVVGAQGQTFLLDMDGKIVRKWEITGDPAKMLSDGSLIGFRHTRQSKDNPMEPAELPPGGQAPSAGPPLPSGQGSTAGPPPWFDNIDLVQVTWDGEEVWSFHDWDDAGTGMMMARQHHDLEREGNPVGYYAPGQKALTRGGKTLILGHKDVVVPEISDKLLCDDVIYEVDWKGNLTGYEWYASDHFDEFGFDETAIEDIHNNPHYEADKGRGDWLHLNTLSVLGESHWYDETGDERFNPDNFMISSRHANFIAIISRETGRVVWRVGPDFMEGTPYCGLGQFIGQHHAHMIPKGLPGAGNILVFNNGGHSGYGGGNWEQGERYTERQYSIVIEFNPITFEIVWEYKNPDGEKMFFSNNISSAQRLPNGNTLIDEGAKGHIFEVTAGKEIIWDFVNPIEDPQGPAPIYRAYRIPPEWVPGNPAGYADWATLYE